MAATEYAARSAGEGHSLAADSGVVAMSPKNLAQVPENKREEQWL
jgi:hypothetical protein